MSKAKRYFDNLKPSSSRSNEAEDGLIEDSSSKRDKRSRNDIEAEITLPVDKVAKYDHGKAMKLTKNSVKTRFHTEKLRQQEQRYTYGVTQAARSEILHNESVEDVVQCFNSNITQQNLKNCVDIQSATKQFDLKLEKTGPYRINYTRNGRHLLLAGKMGHVAAFDWQTKSLSCELNVMETVRDVQWLHLETIFAVSQKKWTYVYDSKGTELHCLKNLHHALRLEFLPYHFLLVGASATSFLTWVDVSIGKQVAAFPTRDGRLDVMRQNPSNGVICLGTSRGTVSMWSPNVNEPLVKVLCHGSPVRALAINRSGQYMATTGIDRRVNIWDLRMLKQLSAYSMPSHVSHLDFSQTDLLATSMGSDVQILKGVTKEHSEHTKATPFLRHSCLGTVTDVRFCPFEDVLGVGYQAGFVSCLVPGAGEANVDALEANPFQTSVQRREYEVKLLLDKIQPEMISIDNNLIGKVNQDAVEDAIAARSKINYLQPLDVKLSKKRSLSSTKFAKRAKAIADQNKLAAKKAKALEKQLEQMNSRKSFRGSADSSESNSDDDAGTSTAKAPIMPSRPTGVLDRFKKRV